MKTKLRLLPLLLPVFAYAADTVVVVPRPQPAGYAPSPAATTVSVKWFQYAVYLESKLGALPAPAPSLQAILDKIDVLALRPGISVAISNSRVILTATAEGTPPIAFQWRKDGADLPGATNNTLAVPGGSVASYSVRASNIAGNATSETIVVTAP